MRRLVTAELGAGPLAIARAQRAQTARILTETTALPLSEIAFAAGFASIRQFNATIREVFAVTPTQLREARGRAQKTRRLQPPPGAAAPGLIRIRLAYRAPIDGERMLGYLGARAIPGVEEVLDGRYRRTVMLPNGPGILSLAPQPGYVDCELQLEDLRDLTAAVQRCRRCSTWTRTPRRSPATCPPTRCSGRWPWPTRGGARPGTSTATSWRCARCSASRSRWPRPGGSGHGWWPRTASRCPALTAR